jgi:DNA-binding HxlR family transcriptional regulator
MKEVSQRVINLHLRELETLGIIEKKIFAEVPARVEYHFTELGMSLLPVMDVLDRWGSQNREQVLSQYQQSDFLPLLHE